MKLRQNAKELVLIEASGLGFMLGEVRYNRQTETVLFALEKAAFFDLYFPCAVIYDQKTGPVVRPHIVTAMTTTSIRVQRNQISCFILEPDLHPALVKQYNTLLENIILQQEKISPAKRQPDDDPDKPTSPGTTRVVSIRNGKEKNKNP